MKERSKRYAYTAGFESVTMVIVVLQSSVSLSLHIV